MALALSFCRQADAQSVTLAWDPSADSTVAGYIVYYSADGTNFNDEMGAETNTFATVTNLQPGATYYFEVVAYDTNHTESAPSQAVAYTVPDATTIPDATWIVAVAANQTNAGSVLGGGSFAAGSTVTVTATANSGYTFANWTGNGIALSSSPSYSFSVETNWNLVASFTTNSVTPVTYTITASAGNNGSVGPPGAQTVIAGGSVTFTAAPTNGYQVNQWLVNGTVAQTGGSTYTLRNVVANTSVAVSFSANATWIVAVAANQTNAGSVMGGGSFAAGSSVTVTATANGGYTFTNWTENGIAQDVSSNYTFNLTDNRNLVANFTTNSVIYTVTASAQTNGGISPMEPQMVTAGGSVTFTAAPTNGYQVIQWLVNGTVAQTNGSVYTLQNVLTNTSVAVTFNANPTVASTNTPPPTAQTNAITNFTVLITGHGSLTPYRTNEVFQSGKKYTLTALAAKGSFFANWVSNGVVVATKPKYTFQAEPNLVVQANFVTNPFVAVEGIYHGLFYDTNEAAAESSGYFAATVTGAGGYTVRINLEGVGYLRSGQFSLAGAASLSIPRPGFSPIAVQLQLDSSYGPMTGTISDGDWTAELVANPGVYSATNHAAGRYTLLIPGGGDASAQPVGSGFAAVTVNTLGQVTLSGSLGDGTPVNATSVVTEEGQWPLYISLYGGKGSILGWLSFTNDGNFGGQIAWFKLAQSKAALYPGGFTNVAAAIGSAYHASLPPLDSANDLLALGGGELAQSITNQVGLEAQDVNAQVQTFALGAERLTFASATGMFKGVVTDPATGKPITVHGIVLQNQNFGAGFFLGTNQSGSVMLSPRE